VFEGSSRASDRPPLSDRECGVKRSPNTTPDEEFEVEIQPIFEDDDVGDNAPPELREADARLRATAAEQHPNG
jgi:hypothetical protein